MKPSDQDRLLRELLGDERLENLRAASLAGALATLRARRRRRAALTGATVAVTLLLALVWHGLPARIPEITGGTPVPPLASQPQPDTTSPDLASVPRVPATPGVQIINDEELFALFPGRSMALIGPPGAQLFVFLDSQ